jgi:5-methylcytosine-specific restriction endonuclease McrA
MTARNFQRLRKTLGTRCRYCRKRLRAKDATVDHIVPLSHGGRRFQKENLAPACRACNQRKADQDAKAFRALIAAEAAAYVRRIAAERERQREEGRTRARAFVAALRRVA